MRCSRGRSRRTAASRRPARGSTRRARSAASPPGRCCRRCPPPRARERSEPSGRDPFLPPGQGPTTTYRAGFDASWEVDLFGRARRAAEATRRDVDGAVADQAAARLSTTAEVAQAWFALRGAEARLAILRRNLENLREDLRILETRREAGRGTELDTSRQATLVAGVAAQLPQSEAEVARQEQRLAVLTAMSAAGCSARSGSHP